MAVRSAMSSPAVQVRLPIYLDGQATTPVAPEVLEGMLPFLSELFGNPSAPSFHGNAAEEGMEAARGQVARMLGASAESVIFTSGATEAINIALQGFARAASASNRPIRIALPRLEHKAVLRTAEALGKAGLAELVFLSVDRLGCIDPQEVEDVCRGGIQLVCLMAANNEIGNLYPVEEVSRIAHDAGAYVFTDATQAVGWKAPSEPLYGADFLAFSGHKVHASKGVGVLAIAPGARVQPVFYGGDQERRIRPGTPNVPAIVGLGIAAELCETSRDADSARVARLRDRLEAILAQGLGGLHVNGNPASRLPGNLNLSIDGVPNGILLSRLKREVSFSLGSACSSSEEGPSHVLRAIGATRDRLNTAVRLGLTRYSTEAEVSWAAEAIVTAAVEVRRMEFATSV